MRADDQIPAAAGSRGRLRASDSDRERVLDILKTAYVQGRLTKDELELRAGQTLASRTWADLTALTADIPAWPLPRPVRRPASQPSSSPAQAFVKAVACVIIAMAAIALAGMPGAWTMQGPPAPSMTAQACQVFYGWQNPVTRNLAMLSVAAGMASRGSDPGLAADLTALQRASLRAEGYGGHPQSAVARQSAANQVQADISRVSNDCAAGG